MLPQSTPSHPPSIAWQSLTPLCVPYPRSGNQTWGSTNLEPQVLQSYTLGLANFIETCFHLLAPIHENPTKLRISKKLMWNICLNKSWWKAVAIWVNTSVLGTLLVRNVCLCISTWWLKQNQVQPKSTYQPGSIRFIHMHPSPVIDDVLKRLGQSRYQSLMKFEKTSKNPRETYVFDLNALHFIDGMP